MSIEAETKRDYVLSKKLAKNTVSMLIAWAGNDKYRDILRTPGNH